MTKAQQKEAERMARIKRIMTRRDCLGISDVTYLLDAIPFLLSKLEQGALGLWESN